MISEALELRLEGGQISHSWCMYVVSHGYGGLGGTGMELHAGQSRGGWSHVGRCRSTSQVRGDDTRSHHRPGALGRVEPELVGLPGKTLTRDATRRLQFIVHAAGWPHSMMLHAPFNYVGLFL